MTSAWQERMSALRNLPPVLKIVWDSGPLVVVLGFVFRLFAALQPVGVLYVGKLIFDTVARTAKHAGFSTAACGGWLRRSSLSRSSATS